MSTARKPYVKLLIRSKIRVTRVVEPGEKVQTGDGRYVMETPPDIYWRADYNDSVYYRRESLGRVLPYSEVGLSAFGSTYDDAIAELASIATDQGWVVE